MAQNSERLAHYEEADAQTVALCGIKAGESLEDLRDLLTRNSGTRVVHVDPDTFGTLLLAGFWDKRLGVLGALGSTGTFIATVTIIPFMPEGWDVAAGGFPAMTGNVPLLMKDVVLFAVSFYLLRQDLVRLVR